MNSICLSVAANLRCQALSRTEQFVLVAPAAVEFLFFPVALALARHAHRSRWLLVLDGLLFPALAAADVLANNLPALADSTHVFAPLDTALAGASALPIALYTLFLVLFARTHLVAPALPPRIARVAAPALVAAVPPAVAFTALAALLGLAHVSLLVPGPTTADAPRRVPAVGFTSPVLQRLALFFGAAALALLVLLQALLFCLAFFRIARGLMDERRIAVSAKRAAAAAAAESDDTHGREHEQVHRFRGLPYIALGLKLGAIEALVGLLAPAFAGAMARRALRLFARGSLVAGIIKGLNTLDDFDSFDADVRARHAETHGDDYEKGGADEGGHGFMLEKGWKDERWDAKDGMTGGWDEYGFPGGSSRASRASRSSRGTRLSKSTPPKLSFGSRSNKSRSRSRSRGGGGEKGRGASRRPGYEYGAVGRGSGEEGLMSPRSAPGGSGGGDFGFPPPLPSSSWSADESLLSPRSAPAAAPASAAAAAAAARQRVTVHYDANAGTPPVLRMRFSTLSLGLGGGRVSPEGVMPQEPLQQQLQQLPTTYPNPGLAPPPLPVDAHVQELYARDAQARDAYLRELRAGGGGGGTLKRRPSPSALVLGQGGGAQEVLVEGGWAGVGPGVAGVGAGAKRRQSQQRPSTQHARVANLPAVLEEDPREGSSSERASGGASFGARAGGPALASAVPQRPPRSPYRASMVSTTGPVAVRISPSTPHEDPAGARPPSSPGPARHASVTMAMPALTALAALAPTPTPATATALATAMAPPQPLMRSGTPASDVDVRMPFRDVESESEASLSRGSSRSTAAREGLVVDTSVVRDDAPAVMMAAPTAPRPVAQQQHIEAGVSFLPTATPTPTTPHTPRRAASSIYSVPTPTDTLRAAPPALPPPPESPLAARATPSNRQSASASSRGGGARPTSGLSVATAYSAASQYSITEDMAAVRALAVQFPRPGTTTTTTTTTMGDERGRGDGDVMQGAVDERTDTGTDTDADSRLSQAIIARAAVMVRGVRDGGVRPRVVRRGSSGGHHQASPSSASSSSAASFSVYPGDDASFAAAGGNSIDAASYAALAGRRMMGVGVGAGAGGGRDGYTHAYAYVQQQHPYAYAYAAGREHQLPTPTTPETRRTRRLTLMPPPRSLSADIASPPPPPPAPALPALGSLPASDPAEPVRIRIPTTVPPYAAAALPTPASSNSSTPTTSTPRHRPPTTRLQKQQQQQQQQQQAPRRPHNAAPVLRLKDLGVVPATPALHAIRGEADADAAGAGAGAVPHRIHTVRAPRVPRVEAERPGVRASVNLSLRGRWEDVGAGL